MIRSLLGALAVAGIVVLSYTTAFLFRQVLPFARQSGETIALLPLVVPALYVLSSLGQALRLSGGRGWLVHRVLAVGLFLLVGATLVFGGYLMRTSGEARGAIGGTLVVFALAVGVAAIPVELYLVQSTHRGEPR